MSRRRARWSGIGLTSVLLGVLGCQQPTAPPPYGTKPDSLPRFADVRLYSATSPFNRRIGPGAAVDPNNDALVASLVEAGDFLVTVRRFSSPVYVADATTPREVVAVPCGEEWGVGIEVLRDVPIPEGAEPAYDGEPGGGSPRACAVGPDQDNHMVIIDLDQRCEYDFWQARNGAGGWEASWAGTISLDGDGVYPHGMSTRGSGLAFLGGVIWPDELAAGEIAHALAFNYPFTRSGGPVAPATDSDGATERPDVLPEGALVQLDPALDLDTLPLTDYELAIARALQDYGMYLVDDGSSGVGLYAIDPKSVARNPYAGILPDEDWPLLPNIPLDRMRVMRLGPQDAAYQDHLTVHESGCGVYE